jgi:multiple sugar transport system permease protein
MKKVIIVLTSAVFFLPVIMTAVMSFTDGNMRSTLQNYADLLFNCFIFYPMFWNSVLYAVIITAAQLLVIVPCAFGFTQAKFRGKSALFVFYIILMMMPLQVTILPNFIGLRDMELINTQWAVILPAIFSPFGVVVMRQYMQDTDNSIIEAGRLETNSVIKIIFYTVVPQIKICIFAVILFVFADCWNMLEQPLLFLNDDAMRTLPVFLSDSGKYVGNVLFPAAVLFIIPILFLYNFFSDNLEKGLTFGDLS